MKPEMPDTLDAVIANAEEGEIPLPPAGGIPPQRIPGWIRWPLRVLMLPWIYLDLAAQKIATKIIRPPNTKAGHCLKRGNCCLYILIPEPNTLLGKLNYFLQTEFNGFYPRYPEAHEYEGEKIRVMGCRYLKKGGSCGHYHLRPMVCRQWPRIEYFGPPRLLKGCGFKAVARKKENPLNLIK